MKTLYHNYFISNFFAPARLVGVEERSSRVSRGAEKSTEGATKTIMEIAAEPITVDDAIKNADEILYNVARDSVENIKIGHSIKNEQQLKEFLNKLVRKGNELKDHNSNISNKYFDLITKGYKNWAIYKNKDKKTKTEVAGDQEVKKLSQKEIETKRTELIKAFDKKIIKLRKSTKNNKDFRTEVDKLVGEYNEEKKLADKGIVPIYDRLIASCKKVKRVDLMERISIPQKLVAEVGNKLENKKVSKFLKETATLKKDYSRLREKFKNIVANDVKKGSLSVTMAMQKSLGFSGRQIDGKIGPKTIAALAERVGLDESVFKSDSKNKEIVFTDNEVEPVVARKEKVAALRKNKLDTYAKRVAFLKNKVDYSKINSQKLAKLSDPKIAEVQKTDILIKEAIRQKKLDNDKTWEWLAA